MSKGNVHLTWGLFDEPGVEQAAREIEVVVDDIIYQSQSVNEAIERYLREFPAIYEKYADFGAQDSEPQTEVCEAISQGMQHKLGLSEYQTDEMYECMRWDGP